MRRALVSVAVFASCLVLPELAVEAKKPFVFGSAQSAWQNRVAHRLQRTGGRWTSQGQPTLGTALRTLSHRFVLRAFPLSQKRASVVVDRARERLGVDYRLQWDSSSRSISHQAGKPIVVSRGLVQQRGMTADGLALILAHEAAHSRGIRSEPDADYWGARHGLRKLWGSEDFSQRRALRAARSALKSQLAEKFDMHSSQRTIELHATGYPTVQSRWNIYKAGVMKRDMLPVGKRAKEGQAELLDRQQAADYLGVSASWLAKAARKKGGPLELNYGGKTQYLKDNLDQFRGGSGWLRGRVGVPGRR